jgi:hypothetical protein
MRYFLLLFLFRFGLHTGTPCYVLFFLPFYLAYFCEGVKKKMRHAALACWYCVSFSSSQFILIFYLVHAYFLDFFSIDYHENT